MANEQLDAFLAEQTAEPAPAPAPTPQPAEAPPAAAAPEPAAKAPPAPEADQDDAEPPSALDGEPVIPRRAYEDERRKRQDYKAQAVRHETRAAELEKQIAELKRAQEAAQRPPQPPVYRPPPPDPATDPQAWGMYVLQEQAKAQVNHVLNTSERDLRKEIGAEKVTEYVNEFRQLSQSDPSLVDKLYSNPDPYDWLRREVDRQRMLRDIGDDPAQYRAKVEAEARAKWEAERTEQQQTAAPPVSPAAGLQPSLATARSVAGRSAPAWSGPTSLDDVVAQIQNRKRPENNRGGPMF